MKGLLEVPDNSIGQQILMLGGIVIMAIGFYAISEAVKFRSWGMGILGISIVLLGVFLLFG